MGEWVWGLGFRVEHNWGVFAVFDMRAKSMRMQLGRKGTPFDQMSAMPVQLKPAAGMVNLRACLSAEMTSKVICTPLQALSPHYTLTE